MVSAGLRLLVLALTMAAFLTHTVGTLGGRLPIAAFVFQRIASRLPDGLALEQVRIMEDPTLYADCTGLD